MMLRKRSPWWVRTEMTDDLAQISSKLRFVRSSRRGFILLWTFDAEGHALVAYLTPREVDKVIDGLSASTGLLEPIRSAMRHTDALLHSFEKGSMPFEIPREGSEAEFIDGLFRAVDSWAAGGYGIPVAPRLEKAIERDLAFRAAVHPLFS